MVYIIVTTIVTIAVAVAAAFFSIYGLAQIFAGALFAVVIMGIALEAGKLLATLILHTYWDRLGILLKTYLCSAVVLLMVVTSSGVYGFLSAAYLKEQIPLQQVNAKLELLDTEYSRKSERLANMDEIISSINPDYISKRLEEKQQQQAERDELIARINVIEQEKLALSSSKIDTEAHIGPIIYMAEVFDKTANEAANFLIMLLIVVFDPLAVALTIAVSSMVKFRREDQVQHPVDIEHTEHIPTDSVVVEMTDGIVTDPSVDDNFNITHKVPNNAPIDTDEITSMLGDIIRHQQINSHLNDINIDTIVSRVSELIPEREEPLIVRDIATGQSGSSRDDIKMDMRKRATK